MDSYRTKNLRILSHIIAGYMLLALIWWGVLLKEQNDANYETQIALLEERALHRNINLDEDIALVTRHYRRQEKMILGEGLFFVIALIIGIWFINRGYTREIDIIRQKRNFLLAITHELKSPLASIGLILETFQKRHLQRQQQTKLIDHGLKETSRLSDLIDNLLLSARLEKSYQVNLVPVNIHDLLDGVITDISHRFEGLKFIRKFTDKDLVGNFDRIGLHSTFYNLIENAAKYSVAGGRVIVETSQIKDDLIIDIIDEGPGVPDDEKKKIFDQFYRSGQEDTRDTHGTGIGLFIVKKMMEFHQGKVELFDNDPKGCIFRITLPKAIT
ncbi:MAG: sensor histidine kinase [Saprospiraceae bacterium]|nr:sensor histidine kinase [Saprospiraceae bacterium]